MTKNNWINKLRFDVVSFDWVFLNGESIWCFDCIKFLKGGIWFLKDSWVIYRMQFYIFSCNVRVCVDC